MIEYTTTSPALLAAIETETIRCDCCPADVTTPDEDDE